MARRRGHTDEQILHALRQAEGGEKVVEVCRQLGISEQTFYTWKRKYAGLGFSELRKLRQLREENAKLKRWWPICPWTGICSRRSCEKSSNASGSARAGALGASGRSGQRASGLEAAADGPRHLSVSESS